MPTSPRSPRLAAAIIAAVALSALSCGREPTGPGGSGGVRWSQGISFNPEFPRGFSEYQRSAQSVPNGAGSLVAYSRVRITLRRASNNEVMLREERDFNPSSPDLPVTLSITLPPDSPSGLALLLTLEYLNTAGETVFTGGPAPVLAVPVNRGDNPPPPVQVTIPIKYTGPGSDARGIRFTTAPTSVDAGQAFTFAAVAIDASGNPIANVPIVYSSQDPSIASITATTGEGRAGSRRGSVSIVAALLTGQTVTAQLTVSTPAATVSESPGPTEQQTGDWRPGQVVSIELYVSAAENQPASGRTVTFSATDGSFTPASVVTDANGFAKTTWTLGPRVGVQNLAYRVDAISGVIELRVKALPAVRLEFVQQPPASVAAGSPFAPVTVRAVDKDGKITPAFTGKISLKLGSNAPEGAALNGMVEANAVEGVATFTNLSINTLGNGYTLVAQASDLIGATSNAFSVVPGAATKLRFQNYPGSSAAGMLDRVSVEVLDQLNNRVTTFAGSVMLSSAASPGLSEDENLPPGVARLQPETGKLANSLQGPVTASVTAGLATFDGLSITRAGRYTLIAASGNLTSATGFPFTISPGPATSLVALEGLNQSGPGGSPLPKLIGVVVTDRYGNGVPGVMVNFAPAPTHGSVNPASQVSGADGYARTQWTLAGAAGQKTLFATSTGPSLNTVEIKAEATSSSGVARTWTGSTSNAFEVATNWLPNGVPGPADQLTINTGSPTNTGTIAVGSLTLASGATLTNSGEITVNGSVDASVPLGVRETAVRQVGSVAGVLIGAGISGNGVLKLAGAGGSTFMGIVANQVVVSGTYSLSGYTQVAGAFQIISGGTLTVNGKNFQVGGDFLTVGTGKLVMTNASDAVMIGGNASFGGGSEHTFLTAGTLRVNRNFNATGASFSATGSHKTVFDGANQQDQTITFTVPVAGRGFFHVDFQGFDNKVLVGSFTAMGAVHVASDATVVTGPGVTAKIGGHFSDATYVLNDTLGAWRVPNTEFFATGTINSQFLTTNVTISGGTRTMAPYYNPLRAGGVAAGPTSQAGVMDAGYAQIHGNVSVSGSTAILDINTTELYVDGHFATWNGGKLRMANEGDYLYVGGTATFGGGTSVLTAGELEIFGSFTQVGATSTAFAPTRGFYTYIGQYCYATQEAGACNLRATAARNARPGQTALRQSAADQAQAARHAADALRFEALRAPRIARREARAGRRAAVLAARSVRAAALGSTAASPGVSRVGGRSNVEAPSIIKFDDPAGSFFGQLVLQDFLYELQSDAKVLGQLVTLGGGDRLHIVESATPRTITSHGALIYGLEFNNVRWVLLEGDAIDVLDFVHFVNMATNVTQFTINRSGDELGGEITGYTLYNWIFGTKPIAPGKYIQATDLNGGAPFVQLNMVGTNPATHGGHVATTGGALINNWVANFTWTGAGGNDLWGTGGNWTTGFAPGPNDDVNIPSGTPFNPRVDSYGYTRNLTIASGVVIQVDGSLYVSGDLTAPTLAAATAGSGYVRMDGSGLSSVSGRFAKLELVDYQFKIADGNKQLLVDAGGFIISGATFDVNGGELHVGGPGGTGPGTLSILNSGRLVMDNAADKVFVGSGGVNFDGVPAAGDLSAGTFTVTGGSLRSGYMGVGAPANALVATASHTFVLQGNSTVDLASPASSTLNNLTLAVGSTTTLASDVTVTGTLARAATGSGTTTITASSNRSLTAGGLLFSSAQPTTLTRTLLTLTDGTANTTFDGVTFSGYSNASAGSLFSVNRASGSVTFNQLHFGGAGFAASATDHFVANVGAANITILNTGAATPAAGTLGIHFVKLGAGTVTW